MSIRFNGEPGVTLLSWIYAFSYLFCTLSFAYSYWKVFGHSPNLQSGFDRRMSLSLRIFSLAIWYIGYAFLFLDSGRIDSKFVGVGILLNLISLVIFWSQASLVKSKKFAAAYSGKATGQLISIGIFKYVRHPFYLSYNLCYIGISLILWSTMIVPLLATMIAIIYYVCARREESLLVKSLIPGSYEAYKKKTGMFLPRLF